MLPAFLITFREVIEATLIVATILGVLYKLDQKKSIKTVWTATGMAGLSSVLLLLGGSFAGLRMQELYTGKVEEAVEGVLMIVSALFITWAVFFLHNYFGKHKVLLLEKVKDAMKSPKQSGIFILVFTAVFREGFEIVLFLSTVYLSSDPMHVFGGFLGGVVAGILVSFAVFSATFKLPVYYAFRATSILLILFAAGLLARGVHEFAEVGIIPEYGSLIFSFLPHKGTVAADMIKSLFGITRSMDMIQVSMYSAYVGVMSWWVFMRNTKKAGITE